MPEDRRAAYRAYDRVRRHELEIVTRLLEEILPEMPKPRGWSHQPRVGRPGPHRRGRPERYSWYPMAKAVGLMHAMGWDYRQAEGELWINTGIREQIGLKEAPSRMTLWRAERRFNEEWLRELNQRVIATFKKKKVALAEVFVQLRRSRQASASTRGESGSPSATNDVSRSASSASSTWSVSAGARVGG